MWTPVPSHCSFSRYRAALSVRKLFLPRLAERLPWHFLLDGELRTQGQRSAVSENAVAVSGGRVRFRVVCVFNVSFPSRRGAEDPGAEICRK